MLRLLQHERWIDELAAAFATAVRVTAPPVHGLKCNHERDLVLDHDHDCSGDGFFREKEGSDTDEVQRGAWGSVRSKALFVKSMWAAQALLCGAASTVQG